MKMRISAVLVMFALCFPLSGCVQPCEEVVDLFTSCPEKNPVNADSCDEDCAQCLIGREATCETVDALLSAECSLRCDPSF